jgi:hypothetical protein
MKMPSIPLQSIPPVTITHSFYQVKSYAGNLGNEYADALARKSITTYSDVADASIKTSGLEGNPFYQNNSKKIKFYNIN